MRRLFITTFLIIAATLCVLAALTLPAAAQTPDDVSPPLSFCIGDTSHCVMPDFNVSTINYDLDAKKWEAGVTSLGVGYMLLFYSDQPWASGLAVHASGQFSQSNPNFLAVTPTVVLLRYLEVGMSFRLTDGHVNKAITLGLGISWDLVSGDLMATRLKTARLRALQPSPPPSTPSTP